MILSRQWDATERRVVGKITQSFDLLQTESRGCNVVGEFIGVPDFFAREAFGVVGRHLRQLRSRFARSFHRIWRQVRERLPTARRKCVAEVRLR